MGCPSSCTDPDRLLDHGVEPVLESDLLKVTAGRGHDAAGHLVAEKCRVELLRSADRQAFGLGQRGEVLARDGEQAIVDVDAMSQLAQVRDDTFGVWQRAAVGKRPDCHLHRADAQIGGGEAGERRQADRAVGMKLERLAAQRGQHGGNQRPYPLMRQDARRILDVDAIDVGRDGELCRKPGIECIVMHRTHRVGQRGDDLGGAGLANHSRRAEQCLHVVHRVEHDEARDAALNQAVIDELHELRMGHFPGDEAKARADELEVRARHQRPREPDQLPGVLAVHAHAIPMCVLEV